MYLAHLELERIQCFLIQTSNLLIVLSVKGGQKQWTLVLCTVCCKPSHVSANLSLIGCTCVVDCAAYIMPRHTMAHFKMSHISHLLHFELSK